MRAELLGTIASKYVTVQKFLNVAERTANVFTADVSQATPEGTAKKVRNFSFNPKEKLGMFFYNEVEGMSIR